MKKRSVQIILAILVAAGGLYLALGNVKLDAVAAELQEAQWGWIALTVLLVLLTLVIRAQRWRILLGRQHSLPDTFGLIGIGYLISGILPLRLGDPARAVAASLRGPVTAVGALSTVIVERALDMLLVVLMLLVTLPFVTGIQGYLETTTVGGGLSSDLVLMLSGGLSLVLLVSFALVAFFPGRVEALVVRLLTRVGIVDPEPWVRPLRSLLEGLAPLRSPREGLAIILWSLLLWLVTGAYFTVGLRAFTPDAGFLQGTVATWASAFGMIFPAPGGIGAFHYAVTQSLNLGFALPEETALAYATVLHGVAYVMGIVVGALALVIWGMSLSELGRRSQEIAG
jgi:hypothetical protein